MQNNNYLNLINFRVKTSLSETFLSEHGVGCSNSFGCCKHGLMGCLNIMLGDVTMVPRGVFKYHME